MLCIRQYSFPCPSTFCWPRRLKRQRGLFPRWLPNTGSTVATRRVIMCLPLSESILVFIPYGVMGMRINRGNVRRIISLRQANRREVKHYVQNV